MTRILLYDADCGFCTQAAGWALSVDCEVRAVPWQLYDDLSQHGITPHAATESLHLVDDDGSVWVGHEAVARALVSSRRGPVRLAGRLVGAPALAPVASRTYRWVARNRDRSG